MVSAVTCFVCPQCGYIELRAEEPPDVQAQTLLLPDEAQVELPAAGQQHGVIELADHVRPPALPT